MTHISIVVSWKPSKKSGVSVNRSKSSRCSPTGFGCPVGSGQGNNALQSQAMDSTSRLCLTAPVCIRTGNGHEQWNFTPPARHRPLKSLPHPARCETPATGYSTASQWRQAIGQPPRQPSGGRGSEPPAYPHHHPQPAAAGGRHGAAQLAHGRRAEPLCPGARGGPQRLGGNPAGEREHRRSPAEAPAAVSIRGLLQGVVDRPALEAGSHSCRQRPDRATGLADRGYYQDIYDSS